MPTICAIVPTFNRAAMLRECLDSLLAQTRPLNEIIVVNDGSSDATEQVVQSYGDRVRLITQQNAGKSVALNAGLAQCASDYVWICDDDDLAAPTAVETLGALLDADPDAGIAFGRYKVFHDDGPNRVVSDPSFMDRNTEPNVRLRAMEQLFFCQFSMLARAKIYRQVGPFREDLIRSQDYEMIVRLLHHTRPVWTPEVIFFQRRHKGARGSAAERFSVDRQDEKWLFYDEKIFRPFWQNSPLEDFRPTFAAEWDTQRATRAALIQRASIMSRKALWQCAIHDLQAAAGLGSSPLSNEEIYLLETVVSEERAWLVLARHRDWIGSLRLLGQSSDQGRTIVSAASRYLMWNAKQKARDGQMMAAMKIVRLSFAILGIRGFAQRARQSAGHWISRQFKNLRTRRKPTQEIRLENWSNSHGY